MPTQQDARQIRYRVDAKQLGQVADGKLDALLGKINTELDYPLRPYATFPTADAKLNFSNASLTAADGGFKIVSPVNSQTFSTLSGLFVNFQTQAVSNAADFSITWPVTNTVGRYRRAGYSLSAAGKIAFTFSSEVVSLGSLPDPGTLVDASGLPLGYIDLECTNVLGYFKTAGSATSIIEDAKIYRFAPGSGAASSSDDSGTGDDLNALRYRVSFRDPLSNTLAIDTGAGKTDSTLFSTTDKYFRLAYDATRTVTGTGTSMTLSGTPSFTIKAGDILRVGTQARRIASITSQTVFTLEAAFSSDPSGAACTVSQAVYTVDLNAYSTSGLSAASQITTSISTILPFYRESVASGDVIFDYGTPLMAFTASSDGSNYTAVQTRTTNLTDSTNAVSLPVAGTNLYLRFFANYTSGSGFVNLLDYKVFFHEESVSSSGDALDSAMCLTNGAGTAVNCSVSSSSGKTRVTLSWSYAVGINPGKPVGSINVIVDGKDLPRYIDGTLTATGYYKEINGSVIELDSDYSGSQLEVVVKRPVAVIDVTTANSTYLANMQAFGASVFAPFVDESAAALLTAVNGTPATGQFRSSITGRAQIPDLANDLRARNGVDRIAAQQCFEIQNEFGPSNERVHGIANDDRGLIRIVGNPTNTFDTHSTHIALAANDYMEVTFYGTGLNILQSASSASRDIRVSVDGGAEGGNIYTATSDVLDGRQMPVNQILPVTSGLTLGLHTVKIRVASVNLRLYGLEVLNESSTINIRPGTAYNSLLKIVNSAAQTLTPNATFATLLKDGAASGSLGTRGGRVVVYLDTDGTIKKSAVAVNSSQANLTSADHSYEDVVRKYNWREFGSGRTDDFSTLTTSGNKAFTLDDGTTTLAGISVADAGINFGSPYTSNAPGNVSALAMSGAASMTFTFVGTGLDMMISCGSPESDTYTISIDGTNLTTTQTFTASTYKQFKVVSGLPYGTHIMRFTRANAFTSDLGVAAFIVYGPKKPVIPTGAVELADYNIVADFAANTTANILNRATGVIRKYSARECTYFGTTGSPGWDYALDTTNFAGGRNLNTSTATNYMEFKFFGTGVEIRFAAQTGSATNVTVAVDGSTNLSGFTTNLYQSGTGLTFTAGTGAIGGTSTSVPGHGLTISGMSLGLHTIRMTQNSAGTNTMQIDAFDVITPLHSTKSVIPSDFQNTFPIGSCAVGDTRTTSAIKEASNQTKLLGTARMTSDISTTSTAYVPVNELTLTVRGTGRSIRVMANITSYLNSSPNYTYFKVYVNGIAQREISYNRNVSVGNFVTIPLTGIVPTVKGMIYKLDVYWQVSGGTGTVQADSSMMTAEEL